MLSSRPAERGIAFRIGNAHGEAAAELEISKRQKAFHNSRRLERGRDPKAEKEGACDELATAVLSRDNRMVRLRGRSLRVREHRPRVRGHLPIVPKVRTDAVFTRAPTKYRPKLNRCNRNSGRAHARTGSCSGASPASHWWTAAALCTWRGLTGRVCQRSNQASRRLQKERHVY